MPRHTKTPTTRVDVNLKAERPVVIQQNRRQFNARGNDRANREAQALQNAFQTGVQFYSDKVDRDNVEGGKRAVGEAGSGQERDPLDKNQRYNKAWDEMDAERDINLMSTELPEILRGADWENLDEDEVRGLISEYQQQRFEGIDPLGYYGQKVSPALSDMEEELILQHRQEILNRTHADQRNTIMMNMKSRFEATKIEGGEDGEFDYEYLAEQTGIFFDGPEKRKVYWETLFDFAVRNGLPDIIRNAPANFLKSGDPTGINDPLMQDEIRAEITSAMTRQAKLQKDADDLFVAESDQKRFGAMMNIYRVGQQGLPVDALIRDLEKIPGTKFTDIKSAKGFADSQFAENEQQSPDFGVIGALFANIHSGNGTASDQLSAVFAAAQAQDLGFGDTAVDNLNELVATIEKYSKNGQVLRTQEATLYRSSLKLLYNDATGGLLAGINPLMQRVKIDALAMYNSLVLGGMSGGKALDKVIREFDPIVANFPQIEPKEITKRRAQSDFTGTRMDALDVVTAIETGDYSVFVGMPTYAIDLRLTELRNNKELSEDQLNQFLGFYQ